MTHWNSNMDEARDLTTAIMIAAEAHEGQFDKGGEPYILHPFRVMLAMKTNAERTIAVLHDVAEDFEAGWQRIHDGDFPDEIIEAVDALTRRKDEGETYDDFIFRVAENPLAIKVKLADIDDNLLPWRSHNIGSKLLQRYQRARATLAKRMK